MSVPAEAAVRAWVNSRADLVGEGNPLSRGAYLLSQRSPADGAYAVISREMEALGTLTAEPGVTSARISAMVYAGTIEAAESACAALRTALEGLTGVPQACGDTGVLVLVSDNIAGPAYVPVPSAGGEPYCFQVSAELVLA